MQRFLTICSMFLVLLLLMEINLFAQNQKKPRVSPKAGVTQTIGFTMVDVSYSRPGVKGREVWGKLVPFNTVWRAGADEATKFIFSSQVTIEGKTIKAGAYSFFAIPGEKEWTLIFNKVADQWGAFEYNISEDALRITVKPSKSDHTEWLMYSFSDLKTTSAVCNLQWEKLKVSFKIEVKI